MSELWDCLEGHQEHVHRDIIVVNPAPFLLLVHEEPSLLLPILPKKTTVLHVLLESTVPLLGWILRLHHVPQVITVHLHKPAHPRAIIFVPLVIIARNKVSFPLDAHWELINLSRVNPSVFNVLQANTA